MDNNLIDQTAETLRTHGALEDVGICAHAADLIENQAAALKAAEDLIAKRDAQIEQMQDESNRDAATIIRLRAELAEAQTRNALQQQAIEKLKANQRCEDFW